jgi:hypothetical protein
MKLCVVGNEQVQVASWFELDFPSLFVSSSSWANFEASRFRNLSSQSQLLSHQCFLDSRTLSAGLTQLTSSLQLPLELANLSLSLLILLLPASDTLGEPIVAIAVDGANTLVNLSRLQLFHGLDGFVVEIVVLQPALLALFGFGDVDIALFNLCPELSRLSVEYWTTYQQKTYQVDWVLNSILGRLVQFGDHGLHVLADPVDYACDPISSEFGAAVCFLKLGDGVCRLL